MMDSQDRQSEIEQLERWLASAGIDAPVEPALDDVKLRTRIALGEAWLVAAGLDPPGQPALDQVKRRVRVALDESWLADQGVDWLGEDRPVGDALSAVKNRLRAELDGGDHGPEFVPPAVHDVTRHRAGRIYRMPSVLAAAAALLFAVGLGLWSASTPPILNPTLGGEASVDDLDALAEVMQRDAAEVETEWTALEAELTELEETLVQGPASGWDLNLVDELDEEIDEVMSDVGLSPEVS
ncbi:MAG: hypothetical protein GY778_12660 [bacterium]|nr:hypothetical protein [bacterium]